MAEETKEQENQATEETKQASTKPGMVWRVLNGLTSRVSLAVLLGISLVMQGVGFWYFSSKSTSSEPTGEVKLGQFHFQEAEPSTASIESAEFTLHLDFLEALDKKARNRLEDRRFRVKQDVEELMRLAKGADFEPTAIDQLKRTLQERINASLEMRVVDEVIITDLQIDRRPATEVAEANPSDVAAPSPAG